MALTPTLDVSVEESTATFEFTVRNDGSDPVEVTFPSAQTVEVVVRADDETWRWSEGRMFAQVVRTATLDPGESLTEAVDWSDPDPGEYVAEATLAGTPAVGATARFSV